MNRTYTQRILMAGVLALLALQLGCTTKTVQTAPMFFARVTVAQATQKTVPVDLTAIGSAEAFSSVSVKAQVNAVLEQVHIKEGQYVKKGDLLFTLDARPFDAALAQAQGTLAHDKAQLELNTHMTCSGRTDSCHDGPNSNRITSFAKSAMPMKAGTLKSMVNWRAR